MQTPSCSFFSWKLDTSWSSKRFILEPWGYWRPCLNSVFKENYSLRKKVFLSSFLSFSFWEYGDLSTKKTASSPLSDFPLPRGAGCCTTALLWGSVVPKGMWGHGHHFHRPRLQGVGWWRTREKTSYLLSVVIKSKYHVPFWVWHSAGTYTTSTERSF